MLRVEVREAKSKTGTKKVTPPNGKRNIRPILWTACGCALGLLICGLWLSGPRQVQASKSAHPSWTLTPQEITWDKRVQGLTDRTSLEAFIRKAGYNPPDKTFVLATRVMSGVGQPAFAYFSYRNTGFVHSRRQFWPASMVKIWAAINALIFLHKFKLNSLTHIEFKDNYGEFKGPIIKLLRKLDNTSYDRLMRIAGRDNVNNKKHRMRYGLRHTILQIAYGKGSKLTVSPKIEFRRNWRRWRKFRKELRGWRRRVFRRYGKIKERKYWRRIRSCYGNCTTLFEMQDILRRVMLHHELPATERFELPDKEMTRLQKAIYRRRHKIWLSTGKILGWKTRAYGKSGSSSGSSQLDNVFLRSPKGRFLVTLGTPWYKEDPDAAPSMIEIEELGKHTLNALLQLPKTVAPVQADAGSAITVKIQSIPCSPLHYRVTASAKGGKQFKGWAGPKPFTLQRKGTQFVGTLQFSKAGKNVIALQGWNQSKPVSYRAFGVTVPAALPAARCQTNSQHMHAQRPQAPTK